MLDTCSLTAFNQLWWIFSFIGISIISTYRLIGKLTSKAILPSIFIDTEVIHTCIKALGALCSSNNSAHSYCLIIDLSQVHLQIQPFLVYGLLAFLQTNLSLKP